MTTGDGGERRRDVQRHDRVLGRARDNTRTVTASVVRAQGVFRGVGRFVEVAPTDAAGVSRDDLVFPSGTIHLVSTG